MASGSLDLANFSARRNADTGMNVTNADFDRIGDAPIQALCSVLALLFFDEENSVPITGFPREKSATNHCRVTGTGDLTFSIASGFGMAYSAAAVGLDLYAPNGYRPIVVDTAIAATLTAHHATLPRFDIVCLAPDYAADDAASRNVKNPVTGAVTASSIAQRRRFSGIHQIVAGTPATVPTVPAAPAGFVEVARARVPATSGPAAWEDTRPVLEFGHFFKGVPRHATGDYVPLGAAAELQVIASSPESMITTVTFGRAVINGVSRFYPTTPLTHAAAHATLARIDLVIARQSGALAIEAGTPSVGPIAPATPANAIPLAEVRINAADATIGTIDITDVRSRAPYGSDLLKNAAIKDQHISEATRYINASPLAIGWDTLAAATGTFRPQNNLGYLTLVGNSTHGFLPLQLPHGSRVIGINVTGENVGASNVTTTLHLRRTHRTTGVTTGIHSVGGEAIVPPGTYTLASVPTADNVVDNETYAYGYRLQVGNVAAGDNMNRIYTVRTTVTTSQHLS